MSALHSLNKRPLLLHPADKIVLRDVCGYRYQRAVGKVTLISADTHRYTSTQRCVPLEL